MAKLDLGLAGFGALLLGRFRRYGSARCRDAVKLSTRLESDPAVQLAFFFALFSG
jgi:hypothetical protein